MKQILTKLHAIMKDVSYIQKDKKNTHQGYTYASEKAIKEAVHDALVTHSVIFTLSTSNPRIENGVTWIDCSFRFLDVDSGEELTGTFLGSGSARDEKGHYAAVTGAIKYALTSTLLIPTGDDPENDEQGTATAPVTPAKTYKLEDRKFNATAIASPKQKKFVADLAIQKLGAKDGDKADIIAKLNAKFPSYDLKSSEDVSVVRAKHIIETLMPLADAKPTEIPDTMEDLEQTLPEFN